MMTKHAMIEAITALDTYPTMNSWNGSYGYSFNVKIHSLPLSHDERDKLYEIIGDEYLSMDFYETCNDVIREYEDIINEYYNTPRSDPNKHIQELYDDKRYTTRCDTCYKPTWYETEQPCHIHECTGTLRLIPAKTDTQRKYILNRQFEIGFNGRSGGHLVLYKWNGYNYGGTSWTHDKAELEDMTRDEVLEIFTVLKYFTQCKNALLRTAREFASMDIETEDIEITTTKTVRRLV